MFLILVCYLFWCCVICDWWGSRVFQLITL